MNSCVTANRTKFMNPALTTGPTSLAFGQAFHQVEQNVEVEDVERRLGREPIQKPQVRAVAVRDGVRKGKKIGRVEISCEHVQRPASGSAALPRSHDVEAYPLPESVRLNQIRRNVGSDAYVVVRLHLMNEIFHESATDAFLPVGR